MNNMENRFGINLRLLIRRSELTLRELGIDTGIPSSTLQRWAHENAVPRVEKRLLILANYFNVSLELLLFGDCSKVTKSDIRLIKERITVTDNGKLIEN